MTVKWGNEKGMETYGAKRKEIESKNMLFTFPAARPSRTIPNFKPETCEEVEVDDDDVVPLAFDAGKIFIFNMSNVLCVAAINESARNGDTNVD